MKNVIILHGTGGPSPTEGNWFRWLEAELTKQGKQVWVPALPNPDLPSLAASADFVRANCPFALDSDALLIGHSSGAILALILAQQNPIPVGGIVAVSVFHDNALGWEKNAKLFDVPFEFGKIKQNAGKMLFVHSDDDPYVPLDQARYVSENCGQQTLVIPGQGHFNLEKSESYREFPSLLELLNERSML